MRGPLFIILGLFLTVLFYTWNQSGFALACLERPLIYLSRIWTTTPEPTVYDHLEQAPISIHQTYTTSSCTNPSVRREWRSLTDGQKEEWIDAVKCLARQPSSKTVHPPLKPPPINPPNPIIIPHNSSGSLYDDFSYVHIGLNDHIHQTGKTRILRGDGHRILKVFETIGFFFPWHRYLLWSFEETMRSQCNFTGVLPYWDWTKDVYNFSNSSMFDSNPKTGLGGFGRPTEKGAVVDGAFARLQLSYPIPHTLRREYTPYPYVNLSRSYFPDARVAAVDAMHATSVISIVDGFWGDYEGFQAEIEAMQGAHMAVHMIMGGDMGGACPVDKSDMCDPNPDATWSPNEPMFWLHHAMIDKLWFNWQRAHPTNYWAFGGGIGRDLYTWPRYRTGAPPAMAVDTELPANGLLLGNYTIKDMFNTTSNGPLCYIYL
ncbi:Di-copper centre-containing protein [Hysterangium stoloniferum]|nr:Di-copper centre-containing protein [Hysterangium stoloniferum]